MINRHFSLVLLSAGLLMASCEKKDNKVQTESYPLLVAGRIYDYGQSDADMLSHSEHIGVYMFKSSSETPDYQNLGYVATYGTRDDYFQPDDIDNIPFFPLEGDQTWDVSAYYPYKESFDGHFTISVADQSKITSATLLYAQARGLSRFQNTAYMHLSPALSRVVFRFSAGDGITEAQAKGTAVKLSGIPTAGNFNVVTAHFTVAQESEAGIATVTEESSEGCSALLIPQSGIKGYTALISVPGESAPREYEFSRDVPSLARGREYVFDIVLNKNGMKVTTRNAPIDPWEKDGNVEIKGEE